MKNIVITLILISLHNYHNFKIYDVFFNVIIINDSIIMVIINVRVKLIFLKD